VRIPIASATGEMMFYHPLRPGYARDNSADD
jgi:hypothetical protein